MVKQFATRFSLIAFATSLGQGVLGRVAFESVMQTALLAGVVFFGLGLLVGELARRVVEDAVQIEFQNFIAQRGE